ncbi:YegS/Rv2252/BmrU family lipid kinase [Patescibacteria group bacterium]|nr:YegS/Rv2252/BmrU family lipid kinase [Patescibacteria group bacterium]
MNKILIVFNPLAGRKYRKNYQSYFLQYFKKCLPNTAYDWLETAADFRNQLAKLHFKEYDRIIIIGGDGTVKIAADYLLNNNLDIPLGIIPAGSANVLASSLNIPANHVKAVKTACWGRKTRIDVGLLNNSEYFIIAVAIGYFQKIIFNTHRSLKIHLGFWAYALNFLKQLKIYSADFKFTIDGRPHHIKGNTMVIANAFSVFKLRPRTPIDLSDGQLEILISKNKTIFDFLIVVCSFFFGKRRFPFLFKAKGKKISVEFSSAEEKMVQIDGETIKASKIEIEIIPKKLTIITK